MELYYRGGQFKDNPIRCYDANFEDLGISLTIRSKTAF